MAVDPSARNQEMSFPSSDGEWSFAITMPSKGMSCGSSSVSVSIYGTPAVVDGSVCIGIYNGKVLKISPSARSQNLDFPQMRSGEWTYPKADDVIKPIVGSPVIADDTVYVCSSDGRVYALDMTYGDEKWRSDPLGDKLWITPAVKEETVYVSTFDGHIYALSAKDGSLLPWAFEAEAGFASSPVLYEDTIFVGSFDRNLYAIRIGDNEPLWKFPGDNWFWAAPVVANGVVYAGCLDGKVYAIDSKTGDELWEFDTKDFQEKDRIVSSPVLIDDLLVVACDSGKVYALDIFNGKQVNYVSIGAPIRGSLCTKEGIVYVCAQDNCLYAMDVGKGKINWRFPLTIK
jgi:outer membrane protein assembly factor BamB